MSDEVKEIARKSKTVDWYLNNVDYSGLDRYVPSQFALDVVNLIKLIEGGETDNKTPPVHYRFLDTLVMEGDATNLCHRGFAKLERASNRILTVNGWVTMRELQVGDWVFNKLGKPVRVSYKTEPKYPRMFRMTLSDGVEIEVGDEHNHEVLVRKLNKETGKREWTTKVVTTLDMLDKGLEYNSVRKSTRDPNAQYRFRIPLVKPIEFGEKVLGIAPYTMGYGIANGTRSKDKYIPEEYKLGSVEQRLALLRGLMDVDGSISSNGSCKYSTYSIQLAKDVTDLVRSLGGLAKYTGYYHKDSGSTEYLVTVAMALNPFRLVRKASKWKPTKVISKAVTKLEEVELVEEGYCIMVDSPCHTYVTEGFTVTHNTTLVEYVIWYIALFNHLPKVGKIPYIIYVSDSMDNGVKKMRRSMEARWLKSKFLQEYLPASGVKFTDGIWDFKNADGGRLVVTGHGAQSGVRGTRENNSRPVLAILDDLFSDTDAKSPTVIANVEDTVYKAIDAALHPTRRKLIWNGTPFNAGDPLYKAVESGAYNVNVFPVAERFPCTKGEFAGSWEDRFTYDALKKIHTKLALNGKTDAFNQEYMLRIMTEEDRVIKEEDIQWYSRNKLIERRSCFNYYITTDIAVSDRNSADYVVLSVWALSNNGDWFWVDGILEKQLMDKTIDDLFRLVQLWNPMSVGLEVSGQQAGFIPWIKNEMMDRNVYFNLASENNSGNEGIRPKTNKYGRFMQVVPWFKSRKMYFPEELKDTKPMQEAMLELRLVTTTCMKAKHDDFCSSGDTLVTAKLPDGSITTCRFDELKDGFEVRGYNEETGYFEWVKVEALCLTGYCSTFTVNDVEGNSIHLTGNHLVMTRRGWVRVDELTNEDELLCESKNTVIRGLRKLVGTISQQLSSLMERGIGFIKKSTQGR